MFELYTDHGCLIRIADGKVKTKEKTFVDGDTFLNVSFEKRLQENSIQFVKFNEEDKASAKDLFEHMFSTSLADMDKLYITKDSKYIFFEEAHESEYSIFRTKDAIPLKDKEVRLLSEYAMTGLIKGMDAS